ncbi:MAG: hypothetical protein ACLPVY_19965 [Acidimicrobiia bacterium]
MPSDILAGNILIGLVDPFPAAIDTTRVFDVDPATVRTFDGTTLPPAERVPGTDIDRGPAETALGHAPATTIANATLNATVRTGPSRPRGQPIIVSLPRSPSPTYNQRNKAIRCEHPVQLCICCEFLV